MNDSNLINRLFQGISKEIFLLAAISLGVFLFVLFFQPFPHDLAEFNDRLLFLTGLGVIVFLLLSFVRFLVNPFLKRMMDRERKLFLLPYLNGLVFGVLNSVAFAFYLRFVGSVGITFHVMVKVVLVSLLPPVVLRMYGLFVDLTAHNEQLIRENQQMKQQMHVFREDKPARTVTFISDHHSGNLNFQFDDILMFRSADNYVQVIYKDQQKTRKKLLRNTMKNIEQQLEPFAGLIRCHRTCIVNVDYAINLMRKNNSYWLTIQDYPEEIPVSRQYLIRTKEALSAPRGE